MAAVVLVLGFDHGASVELDHAFGAALSGLGFGRGRSWGTGSIRRLVASDRERCAASPVLAPLAVRLP
jgi:hypothetical protein